MSSASGRTCADPYSGERFNGLCTLVTLGTFLELFEKDIFKINQCEIETTRKEFSTRKDNFERMERTR